MASALQREEVQALYVRLLRREARDEEVAHQLATVGTVLELLDVVLASAEYRASSGRPAPPPSTTPRIVNTHHPDLARWTHPVGTHSPDGMAVVGHEGWLFLATGSNAIVEQFDGRVQMESDWLEGWTRLVARRRAAVDQLGARMAILVVPDKLAILERHFPVSLERTSRRPVERLVEEAELPVVYPIEELSRAPEDDPVALRTDTHFALRGNELLHSALCRALGVTADVTIDPDHLTQYLISGDLGSRFTPAIVEPVTTVRGYGRATVTEDNWTEISAVGGHIGTRRTFMNAQASDPRTLVLFGDSYGFASDGYQGLSWFLAQQFRHVHFVWVPMGWDPRYAEAVGADLVAFQTAERFVARLPREQVDVRALAADTIRRREARGLEHAFDR